MRYLNILIIFISCISFTNAQDFKYGKVSKEELAQKVHPIDSTANAAVLYREEKINFNYTDYDGFMQEREVYERVKIYNKEGYDWATKKIFVYKGGSGATEKLSNVKGITFNLIDGKVEKDKLRNDGIFEEEYNEYTEINTLTMPNIKDGAIIEYSYKITSPFLEIDDVYFQSLIPINNLEISIATPQFYQYNKQVNLKAFYYPDIKQEKLDRAYKSTSASRSGSTISNTNFSRSNSEYFDNVLKISEVNIPAIKDEAYAGNIDNYMSKMSLELSAILNEYGAPEKSFSSSWEKVSSTIYDYSSFGGQLKSNNFFEDDIKNLVTTTDSPFQIATKLHAYVKSKVKWNGNLGYTARNGIKKAYKEGSGNIGDINLLLTTMLKSQGLDAFPVLISTRNNGIPIFPTRKGFNYVITIVFDGDNYILLDASEFYSGPSVLPIRALNWQGRMVKDNGDSNWIPLRPQQPSSESTYLNIKINENYSAEGKVRKSITSQSALLYRNKFASMSIEDNQKAIEKTIGDIEISELAVEDIKSTMKPVKLSYQYYTDNAVDEIGENIYFSPLLFMTEKESPFKLEKRDYPIDFTIPLQQKYFVNIMIPEGYNVEALPQSEIFEFKEGEVTYSYISKQNGKFLQFNISFDLKNSLIDPSDYEAFKGFYEKIIEKQSQQIVLTKA